MNATIRKAAPAKAPGTAVAKKPTAKPAPAAKKAAKKKPEPPKLLSQGRVLGRPKLDRPPLEQVQTRIPAPMNDYLKLLSVQRLPDQDGPFRQVQVMFAALFERFLEDRPWEHDKKWEWREPRAIVKFANGEISKRTDWRQVNIRMAGPLVKKVKRAAAQVKLDRADEQVTLSEASFCYTAIFWWTKWLYPPESFK